MRTGERSTVGAAARSGGFTYVWLLVALAVMAVGLAAVGELASTAAKREREAELLFAGDQIARAIGAYAASSLGPQQYPQSLEDLLADKRYPNVRRYLRRVYADPMTGRPDWGLVRGPGGGIVGVHSVSKSPPLKTASFPAEYQAFAGAASYGEWVFVPPAPAATKPAAAPRAAGQAATSSIPGSPMGAASSSPRAAVR
jgi:type II secretory pathway pseudopilin PulG